MGLHIGYKCKCQQNLVSQHGARPNQRGGAIGNSDFQRGYETAYAEIYAAVDSDDHPANCWGCRACGVMRTVLEDSMRRLGGKMTPEEFDTLAGILRAVNGREAAAGECGA